METRTDLSILFDLFTVNQRVRRALAETMADSPLDPVEYAVYSLIMQEGPASPTTLARRLGMPVTTFLDQLRVMEAKGHLLREDNPDDGRSYLIRLSPAGLEAHKDSQAAFDATMTRILAALDIDEESVHRALVALADATDAALEALDTDRHN